MQKVRSTFLLLNCLFEFYAGITGATFVCFVQQGAGCDGDEFCGGNVSDRSRFLWRFRLGAMADQIGYVKTTALSGVLMAATNVLFFFGNGMMAFLAAQICLGFACAFESGTLDAWVIDNTSVSESKTVFLKKNKCRFHYDDPFRDAWRCYRGLVPGGDLSVCIDLIGMLYRDQFSSDA